MTVLEQVKSGGGLDELEPEKITQIADAIGVAPKLATLAMLDITPDEAVSQFELNRRLDEKQGRDAGWRFSRVSRKTPMSYCNRVLGTLGLAQQAEAVGSKGELVSGAQITPLGSEMWPMIAGAYLAWEREYPELHLQHLLGSPRPAEFGRASTRMEILDYILKSQDNASSTTEISEGLELTVPAVSIAARELTNLGLLERSESAFSPQRNFKLLDSPPIETRDLERMHPATRAAVTGILRAKQESGTEVITGTDVISLATQIDPDLNPKEVWNRFLHWFGKSSYAENIIQNLDQFDQTNKKIYTVREEFVAPVEDLLWRRKRLMLDDGYRQDMSMIGRRLIDNQTFLMGALRRARDLTKNSVPESEREFELSLYAAIPPEGIEIHQLYGRYRDLTQKAPSEQRFRVRLYSLNGVLDFRSETNMNGTQAMKVYLKVQAFGKNWEQDARCMKPDVDPEIFNEDETLKYGELRKKEAKAICGKCAVRFACLKSAFENGDQHLIRGGMTTNERKKLTKSQKDSVLKSVTIGT